MSIQSEWMDMKLDIIKAFRMDKTKEVRQLLLKLHQAPNPSEYISGEISGMLFIIDAMMETKLK